MSGVVAHATIQEYLWLHFELSPIDVLDMLSSQGTPVVADVPHRVTLQHLTYI